MNRCCRDTLNWKAKDLKPVEGQVLYCRYGNEKLVYQGGEWVVFDPEREGSDIATEAREKAYQRILGRERWR